MGETCQVDIEVIYDDGSREERDRIDVCRSRRVVFQGLDVHPVIAPSLPTARGIMIVNESPRPIQQAFVSPTASGDWGPDVLVGATISAGDHASIPYRGGCRADVRVVFDNHGAEERRDVDLCALGGVAVRPGWTSADTLPPVSVTTAMAGRPAAPAARTP